MKYIKITNKDTKKSRLYECNKIIKLKDGLEIITVDACVMTFSNKLFTFSDFVKYEK